MSRSAPEHRQAGPGQGADLPVPTEHPARYLGVGVRVFQGLHRLGAHADHVVTVPVADRIASGLYPGHPGIPGAVPLMLLPAQEMPDLVPCQLHDRRRPRLVAKPLIVRLWH